MLENELDIVHRAQSGDHNAFEQLVHEYEKRVYNLAFRMCKNEQDALDLSQDIFVRVFKSLTFFKERSSFSTWLYSIASNACIDFTRRQKKLKSLPLVYPDDEGEQSTLEIPDLRYEPEQEYERQVLREDIASALTNLSDEHREILVLREINGLSYQEISEALDISCGTVKSRICRARESLCRILSKNRNNTKRPASNPVKER